MGETPNSIDNRLTRLMISESAALATLAVHADGVCNYIADVAPPIQVSTNYRYSENPDDLVTADQLRVCTCIFLS